jgi:uncharacterized protein (DUF2147 family)
MRSLCRHGTEIEKGRSSDGGAGRWTHGTVYDPNSGKTYKGTITLVDHDTLKLRGYIGISLFGRNAIWSRVKL